MHVERFGRTETVVARAFRQQPVGVIDVGLHAFGLPVGAIRAFLFQPHAFVPMQPHPAQILEDGLFGFGRRTLPIGVFDAEDEGAVLPARQQPVEERGARVADVQVTGWGRGEANAHLPMVSSASASESQSVTEDRK